MPGTTSTALPSFSHDQHHETDEAKRNGGRQKKLEWWRYKVDKEVWRYLQPFGYNIQTWRTDRQTVQLVLRLRIASRGKSDHVQCRRARHTGEETVTLILTACLKMMENVCVNYAILAVGVISVRKCDWLLKSCFLGALTIYISTFILF